MRLRFSYSGIFKFFTIFEKNSFSTSAVLVLLLINSPFSLRWILSLFIDLSDRKGLTVFQKILCYVLLIQVSIVIHFSFSQKRNIYFFAEYIRDNFPPFYVLNSYLNLNLVITSLERFLVIKGIPLPRAYFFFIGANEFKVSMVVLQNVCNPSPLLTKTSCGKLFIRETLNVSLNK